MWEVLHLIDMSDVLVMATVRVYKALVCFNLSRLDVLVDIYVAIVSRDKKVSIVYEDQYVQNLLSKVHNVIELCDQFARSVLSLYLLLLDKSSYDLVAFELISVVFESEQGDRLNLDRLLVFIMLTVAEPDAEVLLRADFDHISIACHCFLHEILSELWVSYVASKDNN